MKDNTCKKALNQKKIIYAVLAFIVILTLVIGFSRAWFYNRMDMETLMEVSPPASISILGPGGSQMTSLDLNYTDADKTDDGKKIVIRRVICVQSEAKAYELEIAHTTNLKDLTFNLYKAEAITSDAGTNQTVSDQGYTYQYASSPIEGSYINLGKNENGYKYADTAKHSSNFNQYDKVQSHAEPLYWKVNTKLQVGNNPETIMIDNKKNYRSYYVCEISWTEEEEKETDMFYILAKTASES